MTQHQLINPIKWAGFLSFNEWFFLLQSLPRPHFGCASVLQGISNYIYILEPQCSGHLSCGITLWWQLSQDTHLQAVALLRSAATSSAALARAHGRSLHRYAILSIAGPKWQVILSTHLFISGRRSRFREKGLCTP